MFKSGYGKNFIISLFHFEILKFYICIYTLIYLYIIAYIIIYIKDKNYFKISKFQNEILK